jgi:hypothetical protein
VSETPAGDYAEVPYYGESRQGCFWLVNDGERLCRMNSTTDFGAMAFCHVHEKKFLDSLVIEIQENPRFRDRLINTVALYDREEALAWTQHRREVREWPSKYGRAHCVYFAERDGFVKIGRTTDLGKRMHDIGKGSCMPQGMSVGPVRVLAVIHCACETKGCVRERYFHDKFRGTWLEGEWFLLDQEMASFIGGLEDCLDDRLREVSAPVAGGVS